ncbi:unnamed protein product, partial [marine sediment metagenome]
MKRIISYIRMKNINILVVFIALLSLVSCKEDFLDISPYDRKVV